MLIPSVWFGLLKSRWEQTQKSKILDRIRETATAVREPAYA